MITLAAYIESLLNTAERFRTISGLHPVTDHYGQLQFAVSDGVVSFAVVHEGRPKSLRCKLMPQNFYVAADSDRILNISNKNNPYIASCEVRKNEMLAFDTTGTACWYDVMLCERPDGVALPAFVRANLNRSDRKPLRELLRNIAAMAESLRSDNIVHGNLKPENIFVAADGRPCAVNFAASTDHTPGNDTLALGLLGLNIFILGCEPMLFSLWDETEMFRPATFLINMRHIRAQTEFSKMRIMNDLVDLLTERQPAADGNDSLTRCNASIDREKLCAILSRLAALPFESMPLLLGLSSATNSGEAPVIESEPIIVHNFTITHSEDNSANVDFRRCEFVGDISDTLIRFCLDGKWGFAERYGRKLFQEEYLSAEDFYEGRAKVETTAGCGLIDRNGEYIMLPEYEILEWCGEENVVAACREGRWDIYDRGGKQITAASYDWIGGAAEGTLIVRRGNKFGFITSAGIPITDIRYDEAYSFRDGSALVMLGDDVYRIDKTGRRA